MAVTIIATAGATDANSYATLAEATTYMDSRLHKENWNDASSSDKSRALVWATRLLDELCQWNGTIASDTQALRWPRTFIYDQDGINLDSDSIPAFLKNAVSEYAFYLIGEDRTAETNPDMVGLSKIKVDVIQIQKSELMTDMDKPIIPQSVWTMVRFYTASGGRKYLVRA